MRTLIIIIFLLLVQSTFSQDEVENDLNKNYIECLNLHEFVMDSFVELITNVYVGDEPFFIIVQRISNTPSIMHNDIVFTYTQSYQTLLDYELALFYKYEERENVYIILDRFNDSKLKVFYAKTYTAEVVSLNVLKNIFYPLTIDDKFLSMPKYSDKSIEDCHVYKRPWYGVISNDDGVKAVENANSINYFTNYRRKYFNNSNDQKEGL